MQYRIETYQVACRETDGKSCEKDKRQRNWTAKIVDDAGTTVFSPMKRYTEEQIAIQDATRYIAELVSCEDWKLLHPVAWPKEKLTLKGYVSAHSQLRTDLTRRMAEHLLKNHIEYAMREYSPALLRQCCQKAKRTASTIYRDRPEFASIVRGRAEALLNQLALDAEVKS